MSLPAEVIIYVTTYILAYLSLFCAWHTHSPEQLFNENSIHSLAVLGYGTLFHLIPDLISFTCNTCLLAWQGPNLMSDDVLLTIRITSHLTLLALMLNLSCAGPSPIQLLTFLVSDMIVHLVVVLTQLLTHILTLPATWLPDMSRT